MQSNRPPELVLTPLILDAQLGMLIVGRTPKALTVTKDIYRHTMRIISDAEDIGRYRSLDDLTRLTSNIGILSRRNWPWEAPRPRSPVRWRLSLPPPALCFRGYPLH